MLTFAYWPLQLLGTKKLGGHGSEPLLCNKEIPVGYFPEV